MWELIGSPKIIRQAEEIQASAKITDGERSKDSFQNIFDTFALVCFSLLFSARLCLF